MTEHKPVTHAVGYSRKITDGDYGNEEYSVYIGFEGDFASQIDEKLNEAREVVQAAHGQQTPTGATDTAVQELQGAFPGAMVQPEDEAAPAPEPEQTKTPAEAMASIPPHSMETKDKEEKAANKRWAIRRLEAHPDEFYDNSEKKAAGTYKPTAPDFKHIKTNYALWL